jgi:hypothetical protein
MIVALAVSSMGSALVPALKADEWDKKTNIKIDQSIDVQGTVLPPGSYGMKLLSSPADRQTVQMGVSVPRHPQRWATGGLSDSGVQDAGDGSRVLSDVRRGGELFSAAAEDGGSRVAGQAAGVIYRAVLNVARSVLCCGIKKSEPMVIRTRNSPIYSETEF